MNGTTTQAPLTLDIKGAAALLGVDPAELLTEED